MELDSGQVPGIAEEESVAGHERYWVSVCKMLHDPRKAAYNILALHVMIFRVMIFHVLFYYVLDPYILNFLLRVLWLSALNRRSGSSSSWLRICATI